MRTRRLKASWLIGDSRGQDDKYLYGAMCFPIANKVNSVRNVTFCGRRLEDIERCGLGEFNVHLGDQKSADPLLVGNIRGFKKRRRITRGMAYIAFKAVYDPAYYDLSGGIALEADVEVLPQ